MTAPHHRWSIGLWTLLLSVAIVTGWLGWEAERVHERRRITAYINAKGGFTFDEPLCATPLLRAWIGDPCHAIIVLPSEHFSSLEATRVAAMFPESMIHYRPESSFQGTLELK